MNRKQVDAMNLKLIKNNSPLDYEINDLLGTSATDYLVLHADGKKVDFWGTPPDSEKGREEMEKTVKWLNDPKDNFWLKCLSQCPSRWQRILGEKVTDLDYRPNFDYAISRTCAAYSKHAHAAIQLLEEHGEKIARWSIRKTQEGSARTEIFALDGKTYSAIAKTTAESIATAFRDFISSNNKSTNAEGNGE